MAAEAEAEILLPPHPPRRMWSASIPVCLTKTSGSKSEHFLPSNGSCLPATGEEGGGWGKCLKVCGRKAYAFSLRLPHYQM
ncbi:uncharacterized [Tachysurus ichikawai]